MSYGYIYKVNAVKLVLLKHFLRVFSALCCIAKKTGENAVRPGHDRTLLYLSLVCFSLYCCQVWQRIGAPTAKTGATSAKKYIRFLPFVCYIATDGSANLSSAVPALRSQSSDQAANLKGIPEPHYAVMSSRLMLGCVIQSLETEPPHMLLTVRQAAELLGLSQSNVYQRIYSGQFAGVAYELPSSNRYAATSKSGKRRNLIRFDKAALEAWREQYRVGHAPAENREAQEAGHSLAAIA